MAADLPKPVTAEQIYRQEQATRPPDGMAWSPDGTRFSYIDENGDLLAVEGGTGKSQVLVDRDCSACDRLGIRADLAKPSTYILDTRGKLVYAYVGVTTSDRPSLKAILAQLDQAQ